MSARVVAIRRPRPTQPGMLRFCVMMDDLDAVTYYLRMAREELRRDPVNFDTLAACLNELAGKAAAAAEGAASRPAMEAAE